MTLVVNLVSTVSSAKLFAAVDAMLGAISRHTHTVM